MWFYVRLSLFLVFSLAGVESLFSDVFYTIQRGDSLFSICKKNEVSVQQVMKLNGLKDPTKIKVGQKIRIPTKAETNKTKLGVQSKPLVVPERYVVQSGDSYEEISNRFEINLSDLRAWNHGVELEEGVVLLLRKKDIPEVKREEKEEEELKGGDSKFFFIGPVKHLIDLPKIQRGRWKYIVVHHSATSSGNAAIFDLAHRQRGMENGLAYHFVIGNGHDTRDGEIEVGNRWLKQLQGGHLRSEELNMVAIGICFVGNFEETRPTRRQQAAAIELINYLRQKIGAPYPEFKAHREINPMPTSCPGHNFPVKAFHRIFDRDE